MIADGGHEVAFHGELREIVPDGRTVSPEVYQGAPEGEPAVNLLEEVHALLQRRSPCRSR
jgi:hypothetical protein